MSEHLFSQMKKEHLYYAVLTHSEYLNPSNVEGSEFFVSGQKHISYVLENLDKYFGPINSWGKALDFGCGVGRLVIPLAKRFSQVIGVDVSKAMIEQASLHCSPFNVQFEMSLEAVERHSCDLIHSYIVFQHIPPKQGLKLLQKLITCLKPGGYGMVHITFHTLFSSFKRGGLFLRRHSPLFHKSCNLLQKRTWNHPCIPMYTYNFSSVFEVFAENGISDIHVCFEQHGAYKGACLFFRKNQTE